MFIKRKAKVKSNAEFIDSDIFKELGELRIISLEGENENGEKLYRLELTEPQKEKIESLSQVKGLYENGYLFCEVFLDFLGPDDYEVFYDSQIN